MTKKKTANSKPETKAKPMENHEKTKKKSKASKKTNQKTTKTENNPE
jgi:hypothetical protein